jgi:hypothetical protein
MDLSQLFFDPAILLSRSVVCFRAQQHYPLLFFSVLLQQIKKRHDLPVEMIDLSVQDVALVKGRLETSFLGQTIFCWLRNISDVPVKVRKELLSYLATYTGPNKVAFFAYHGDVPRVELRWLDMLIPEAIDRNQFVTLATQMYGMQELYARQCAPLLVNPQATMQLDDACLLTQYAMLVGSKNVSHFTAEWLDQLIKPKSSLFILSKHFFAKDARSFFPVWLQISKQYPMQFWIAFWSEQLWSAAAYVNLMRKNDRIEAKKVSNRLPVTFLQKNWRDYSMRELKKAHDCIYALDHALKNGGSEFGLDLFYSQFFQNQLS